MTKVFPVVFGLITLELNAGATLYFVVSNAWRIGQQHLVLNKIYDQAIAAGDLKPVEGWLEGRAEGQPRVGGRRPRERLERAGPSAKGSGGKSSAPAKRPAPKSATPRRRRRRPQAATVRTAPAG